MMLVSSIEVCGDANGFETTRQASRVFIQVCFANDTTVEKGKRKTTAGALKTTNKANNQYWLWIRNIFNPRATLNV